MVLHTENKGLYIGGEWVRPLAGGEETVLNPATEEVIGMAPLGGAEEIEMALAAAREAFDRGPWPRMSMAERIKKVEAFLANLESKAESLQALIVAEVGCVRSLAATAQFLTPFELARYAIEEARRLRT